MSNDNRVLNRMGARQLKEEDLEGITGGAATLLSVIPTGTPSNPDQRTDT